MPTLLSTLLPWRDDPDAVQACTPRPLTFTAPAKRLWELFHDNVEGQLGEGEELAPIRGFGNKAAEHAARLAAIVTLVENPEATTLGKLGIEAGIALTEFYLAEALRLCDVALGDPELAVAEATLAWLHAMTSCTSPMYINAVPRQYGTPRPPDGSSPFLRSMAGSVASKGAQTSTPPIGTRYGGSIDDQHNTLWEPRHAPA